MSILGKCPECKNNRDIILINGGCKYHPQTVDKQSVLTELKASVSKTKHIAKKSAKLIDREKEYNRNRKPFLVNHQVCEANLQECTKKAQEIHHKAGRIGKLLTDQSNWLAVCRKCHIWITTNSKQAIEMGLSESRIKLKNNNV